MNRSMNIKGFLVIIGTILIVFFTLHILMQNDLHRKAEKEEELRTALAKLEEENNYLAGQMDLVGTDDYIAYTAIQNYSYVNRDDIRFEYSKPQALDAYTEAEVRILVEEMAQ